MVRPLYLFACLVPLVAWYPPAVRAADALNLRDGDRVVLVGNTMIEREQRYGYWELALTRRYPGKKIIFRNLGWSGDTVFGEARAGFGSVADGFRELKDHVLALKPTVIIIGYGANEAFEGKKGLPRFVQGLNTLLDTFAPTKARIVLLSPIPQEDLGRPLPDPSAHNKNLRLYADAIRDVAKNRKSAFVDLYNLFDDPVKRYGRKLTDNGIHMTPWGYWCSGFIVEEGLGLTPGNGTIEINAKGEVKTAGNVQVDSVKTGPLRFQATQQMVPLPMEPHGKLHGLTHAGGLLLRLKDLPEGNYSLLIDGNVVLTAPHDRWSKIVFVDRGPDMDQAEKLRQAIIAKNRLYFYRWRPQNVTYLFGFRKHEQGKNAREIPLFDPLVAAKEAEIFKLNKPVTHTYELRPVKK